MYCCLRFAVLRPRVRNGSLTLLKLLESDKDRIEETDGPQDAGDVDIETSIRGELESMKSSTSRKPFNLVKLEIPCGDDSFHTSFQNR
jgi:hypothetical protein